MRFISLQQMADMAIAMGIVHSVSCFGKKGMLSMNGGEGFGVPGMYIL